MKLTETEPRKCLVHNCTNTIDQGKFIGDVCSPCHKFITTGDGRHSQVYRNGANSFLQNIQVDVLQATHELTTLLKTLERT